MTISTPTPTALAEGVALFDQSADYVLDVLAGTSPADLDRPTPCPGWEVRAVLSHLADVTDAAIELVATGQLEVVVTPRSDGELVAGVRDRTERLRGALGAAVDRDRLDPDAVRADWALSAARVGAIELTTHAWDLATAGGSARQIPPGLAAELLELTTALIDDGDREPRFHAAVPVGTTASAGDRFVAFMGRRPDGGPAATD